MTRSIAVIGAGYGDEGKGLMTDYLTAEVQQAGEEVVVVKHNGGAQAAHTVVTQGLRHVHKHLGSGTLRSAPTFLARDFISNPIIFREEVEGLQASGVGASVFADPDGRVSLPMDMIVNQIAETARGRNRHGSCGWGINEAVMRSVDPLTRVTVRDLQTLDMDRLLWLKRNYLSQRLAELGIRVPSNMRSVIHNEAIEVQFLEDVQFFLGSVEIIEESEFGGTEEVLIFETGQGLGLDQRHGHFPHVTRSNTGLGNAKAMAARIGVDEMEVVYVTRAYATRHGAGPLECEHMEHNAAVEDETNVEGPWQGELRTAPLFVELVRNRIHDDYERYGPLFHPEVATSLSLAVTCLDQIAEGTTMFYRRDLVPVQADDLLGTLVREIEPTGRIFAGRGPMAENVGVVESAPVAVTI